MLRKKRIIIGIHGVGNKPPQPLLQMWWRRAICEGLDRIDSKPQQWKFELVYWAHFLYSDPLKAGLRNPEHPLHIDHPYTPARKKYKFAGARKWRKRTLDLVEVVMDWMFLTESRFFNFDRVSDYVVRKNFSDLALYYHKDNPGIENVGIKVRELIRTELAKVLKKHRRKEIMLVAHSMGTIIAYDVLTHLVPDIKIHTLVTLGSPLGLPNIMKKIYAELGKVYQEEKLLPAPENLENAWLNFSDLKDPIALNYSLENDFHPNSRGIGPRDIQVNNDYEYKGKASTHKSYGYLRAAEVSQVIDEFLTAPPVSLLGKIKGLLRGQFARKQNPEPAHG